MRLSMSRRLAILGCLVVLGCSDSLEPEEVAGLYVFEQVGSEALPAVIWESEERTVWVTSGSIRLRADGSGTISGAEQSISRQDGLPPTNTGYSERPIRFRTDGLRIEIEIVCAPNESCLPPPHLVARPTPGGLRVSYFELRTPLHYARVDETE